MKVIPEIRCVY